MFMYLPQVLLLELPVWLFNFFDHDPAKFFYGVMVFFNLYPSQWAPKSKRANTTTQALR